MNKPTPTSWTNSVALEKLQQAAQAGRPLRLAFLDIDGTWTGNPSDQQALRHTLEALGYVIIPTTNRDLELNVSFDAFKRSGPAIAGREYGDVDRATVLAFSGLLDADIIASTLGEEIALKQRSGGYLLDEDHQQSVSQDMPDWSAFVAELLAHVKEVSGHTLGTMLPSPHLRIQVTFDTLEEKKLFQATIQKIREAPAADSEFGRRLAITSLTDESDPYIEPPFFSLYITPAAVSKKNAVEHIVTTVAQLVAAPRERFEVLLAGDGPADAEMGFHGALGTQATFVIPGEARLTKFISAKAADYLGEISGGLTEELYSLTDRTIIMGDEAFPSTVGPTTLLAWLNATR
jgi:hydroxymethylpyrimidine pyrophosphatase-like HAD family hydrolase